MTLTVLLVDDDPLMHRILVPRLREMETAPPVTAVLTAKTPDEAMAALRGAGAGPLVVLSDFNLKASRTGAVLLREVRAIRPDALRVLFSGYSLEQLGQVHTDADADAFLEKPLLLDDLIRPLAKLIEGRFGSSA